MMRARWRPCCVVLLLCAVVTVQVRAQGEMVPPAEVIVDPRAPLGAEPSTYSPPGDPAFQIGIQTWFSKGAGEWTISFDGLDPIVGLISGKSKLEWEDLDSIVVVLHGEYRFNAIFRMGASIGGGSIDDGRETDTDWITAPELGLDNVVFSVSEADTSGDTFLLDLNLYVRLNELFEMRASTVQLDFIVGYQYYQDDLKDRNGVQRILLEEEINEPFAGLNSTYMFEWRAVRLGLRGQLPIMDRLSLHASAVALLGVSYEGEGFWNLRSDFRSKSPNFRHEASSGTGMELKASLMVAATEYIFLELGYWWLELKARNGEDVTYFANGAVGVTDLDDVTSTRHGAFIGIGGRF